MEHDRGEQPRRREVRCTIEQRLDAVSNEHLAEQPAEEAERHDRLHGEERPAATGLGRLGGQHLGHVLRISSARRSVKFVLASRVVPSRASP